MLKLVVVNNKLVLDKGGGLMMRLVLWTLYQEVRVQAQLGSLYCVLRLVSASLSVSVLMGTGE